MISFLNEIERDSNVAASAIACVGLMASLESERHNNLAV